MLLMEIECSACGEKLFALKRCEQCRQVFRPVKRTQRYCCDECRKNYHLRQYHERKVDVLKMAGVAPPTNGFARRY